jgi:hypothetical protein
MTSVVQIEIELPNDLARFRLPGGVQEWLTTLLDKQDGGQLLTDSEQREAEGLVNLSEFLSLLRLRAERAASSEHLRQIALGGHLEGDARRIIPQGPDRGNSPSPR